MNSDDDVNIHNKNDIYLKGCIQSLLYGPILFTFVLFTKQRDVTTLPVDWDHGTRPSPYCVFFGINLGIDRTLFLPNRNEFLGQTELLFGRTVRSAEISKFSSAEIGFGRSLHLFQKTSNMAAVWYHGPSQPDVTSRCFDYKCKQYECK